MLRSHRWAVLLMCTSLSACSLVTDFDRNKIDRAPGDRDGSAGDAGIPGMDASMDAGGRDAAVDSGGRDAAPDAEPMPECTENSDCGDNELCCDETCVAATFEGGCESCGTPCVGKLAVACEDRTCVCEPGSGSACSGEGEETFCNGEAAPPVCVECRDSDDCAARTDGKNQCVNGACVQCDPQQGNGCSGDTPICNNSGMCEACTANPDNCPGDLVCTGTGACGGCANSATDCSVATAPICDDTSTQCRGCATNQECMAELARPYCVGMQRCSVCNPDTEAGCTASSTTPDCRLNTVTGQHACQGCRDDADCANLPASRRQCDSTTGRCVECTVDNDCSDPDEPLCHNNACVACNANGVTNADSRCNDKPGTDTVACVSSGAQAGQCGRCDPADHAGCMGGAGGQFCSASLSCVECLNVSHCGNDICVSGSCTDCASDAQCAGHPVGAQCTGGNCRACDPADDAGCTGLNGQCHPSTFTCVRCLTNADCGGNTPVCNGSNQCVGCTSNDDCAGSASGSQCAPTGACVPCILDAQCTSATAPLCHNNACVACNASGVTNADARCNDKPGTDTVACVSTGPSAGQCRGCDPADDSGCSSATNDQCNPDTLTCVDCVAGSGCPSGQVCMSGGNTCVQCNVSTDCSGGQVCQSGGNVCVQCNADADCTAPGASQCVTNTCRACDPANNAGCSMGQTCNASYQCVGGVTPDAGP